MRCDDPWARAFTLVEMLVTITVIGIISAVTVPAMQGVTTSTALSTGAREFSNVLSVARNEAIARNTNIRFAVAKDWDGKADHNYRKYSLWEWNDEIEDYEQVTPWNTLPEGVVLEPYYPDYIKTASYVEADTSAVRGDYILEDTYDSKAQFSTPDEEVYMNFIEFLPNGSVRIPSGTTRNAIYVLTQGFTDTQGLVIRKSDSKNWAQVNIDSLTGRVRLYRP